MSFLDNCEEHAFEQGRSMALESFTTSELVEELVKRDGVWSNGVTKYGRYKIQLIDPASEYNKSGDGAARILVLKP